MYVRIVYVVLRVLVSIAGCIEGVKQCMNITVRIGLRLQ
jgi:hypothetical protein